VRRAARAGGAALLWAGLAFGAGAFAAERPVIDIEDARQGRYRIAVQRFHEHPGEKGKTPPGGEALHRNLLAALEFSGVFAPLEESTFAAEARSPALDDEGSLRCNAWRALEADAVLQGNLQHTELGGLRARFRLWDVPRCQRLIRAQRFSGTPEQAGRIGKAIADQAVEAFTGLRGVAETEIAFISNRSGHPEVFIMDADGGRQRPVTRNGSLNAFPSWSPDADSLVYTSYRYRNRPRLFLATRAPRPAGRILRGLGGGAPLYRGAFAPAGSRLAVVMSAGGGTELFTVGLSGGGLLQITRNRAIEVSPTWSPDGERLAFVSDRSGLPQIYVMNARGGRARRITFDGVYNAAPSWSPDGRWIAYQTRVNGQFDIWLIDPEGRVNVPLVTHARSDEHPAWSPDGRRIVFQSGRRGRADLYAIGVNGSDLRRLTERGENMHPAWGPFRR